MADLASALSRVFEPALASAVAAASTALPAGSAPGSLEAIAAQAADAASRAPELQHLANAEPWYRSRVTWGAILSAVTPLLALMGWTLTPEYRDEIVGAIVALAPLVGAAVTLYGRWRARRPLGVSS